MRHLVKALSRHSSANPAPNLLLLLLRHQQLQLKRKRKSLNYPNWAPLAAVSLWIELSAKGRAASRANETVQARSANGDFPCLRLLPRILKTALVLREILPPDSEEACHPLQLLEVL